MRIATGSKIFFRWKCAVVAGFKKWCCGKMRKLIIAFGEIFTDARDAELFVLRFLESALQTRCRCILVTNDDE